MSKNDALFRRIVEADDAGSHSYTRYLCEQHLRSHPDHAQTLLIYAEKSIIFRQYDEAWAALDRAEETSPVALRGLVSLRRGQLLQAEGDFDGAEEEYLEAHQLAPEDAGPLIFAASACFNRGDVAKAKTHARKATGCAVGSPDEAWFNLGGYLLSERHYEDARGCYLKALEIDPEYGVAKRALRDVDRVLDHDRRAAAAKRNRSEKKVRTDLVHYLSPEDVGVVISRLPDEVLTRLRDVFFSDDSLGVRSLGSVVTKGRRDITLYSVLPARMSLGRYILKGQSALEFGAPSRGQWPPWAIRRFLLYDVFLHELGHLQLVYRKSKSWRRKYAGERVAEDFATKWRRDLWKTGIDHPDVVHSPPAEDEISFIDAWKRLDKLQRFHLVELALNAPHAEPVDLARFGNLNSVQRGFLTRVLNPSRE